MPAAAVIPAPIAYINVVAVKKLVVGFLVGALAWGLTASGLETPSILRGTCHGLAVVARTPVVYCEQIRVFKARCT